MLENTQTALMLGKIEALNNSDCNKYEYICSDNNAVCANCRPLKDRIFDSKDANIGVNFPPIHPYCRCDIVGINNDGETVKFADGNIFTPEILKEMGDLLTALWNSAQTRTDKALNEPNFYNISNYLTVGAFDAIKNMLLKNEERGKKAYNNPTVYNIGNWISSGLFDTIKGTFNAEKPLSLQHWLDSLSTALMAAPIAQKAGGLIDDVANSAYKGVGNALPNKVNTKELVPNQNLRMGRNKFNKFVEEIKTNGIQEPIKYVEYNGKKYIVDGHNRLQAAKRLGITEVPVEEVKLPYLGYKTIDDLLNWGD